MDQRRFYAGIGSRRTPADTLAVMRRTAAHLAKLGWTLRSGAAAGADQAFEMGCREARGEAEIWLPWRDFGGHEDTGLYPTAQHEQLAALVHPAWQQLSSKEQQLHARTSGQVLGMRIDQPVEFVLCWTEDGC